MVKNNVIHLDNETSVIEVYSRGVLYCVLVDRESLPVIGYRSIHVQHGYARMNIPGKTVSLHRFLMGFPEGMQVDHINRVPLDCRLGNLRVATDHENRINKSKYKSGVTSRYKGVAWIQAHNAYRARFCGKHLGYFSTEKEAHAAFIAAGGIP